MLFGLRGGNENRQLRWGDIKLKRSQSGREYIEYNERITKTRTGETTTEVRAFNPKQFAHATVETCPVYAYKMFTKHRPVQDCQPESPFYLAINHLRKVGSEKWFKSQPLGVNTLNTLMKVMATDCGLQGKKTNHSARKTTCTELLHGGIAPTTIQQLSAHRNVQSVNNYANASLEMQAQMSDMISHNPNPPQINNISHTKQTQGQTLTSNCQSLETGSWSAKSVVHSKIHNKSDIELYSQNTGQLFQNARLLNCQITIINKTVKTDNTSPPVSKRRRIIDSDSD